MISGFWTWPLAPLQEMLWYHQIQSRKNPISAALPHRIELGRMYHPGWMLSVLLLFSSKRLLRKAAITLPSVFLNWFFKLARLKANLWSCGSSRLKFSLVFQVPLVSGPLPVSELFWKLFQTSCLLFTVMHIPTFNRLFLSPFFPQAFRFF